MRSHEKSRDAASKAVIALRTALGKTQQEFAVEVVKTTIGTVAVWETTRPPRGDALIRLADVANENGYPAFAEEFRELYADEVWAKLKILKIKRPWPRKVTQQPELDGYVMASYHGLKDALDTAAFLERRARDLRDAVAAFPTQPKSTSAPPRKREKR
jgi:hypothetical protein